MKIEDSRQSQRAKLATSLKEYHDLLASDEEWFARTADDLKQLRNSRSHPLSHLSLEDFHEFLDSLVFHDGGIVGANYKPLMTLPLTQVFEVFESFGIHRGLLTRAEGEDLEYKLIAPGVCEFSFWDICLWHTDDAARKHY
ncbi:hypothetical protein ACIGDI_40045 [Streptomyces sp. NPDC085900]|uniref:hypothetical protein n=1 Tax=Streptomyces sp. NPDC085900 TaxID=3365737 RepID=UPI0037D69D21